MRALLLLLAALLAVPQRAGSTGGQRHRLSSVVLDYDYDEYREGKPGPSYWKFHDRPVPSARACGKNEHYGETFLKCALKPCVAYDEYKWSAKDCLVGRTRMYPMRACLCKKGYVRDERRRCVRPQSCSKQDFINNALGSYYKFKDTALSWIEAFAECESEGYHLAVINSAAEAEYLQVLARGKKVKNAKWQIFLYLGFKREAKRGESVFMTIFNQTLEEAGYAVWGDGEPNNVLYNEFCGSFYRENIKLNDIACETRLGYICEKEINE